MTTLPASILLIVGSMVLLPLTTLAASRVDLPTSIQVVDRDGRTTVSTGTAPAPKANRTAPFILPDECSSIKEEAVPAVSTETLSADAPSRTRIESQRAVLDSLASRLSFSPYLPSADEERLRLALHGLGQTTGTSSDKILECISTLDAELRARGSKGQEELIESITTTVAGIHYGLLHLNRSSILPPRTIEEARYAGDLLIVRNPEIDSLVIHEDRVETRVFVPVMMFRMWKATATVQILATEDKVRLDAPWWTIFGSHQLSQMRERLETTPLQEEGFVGMFLRAQDLILALYP